MSRKTRKLIWPLPGMAIFAIVAALAILVALPVGIALAQQMHQSPSPTALKQVEDISNMRFTQISLMWMAPEAGSPVSYRVDYSEDGMVWHLEAEMVSGTTHNDMGLNDIGLMAGTMRHYRVFARYSGSPGPLSAPLTMDPNNPASTAAPMKAGPPTLVMENVDADATDAEIAITWTGPNDPDGAPVTGFQIEYSADGVTGWRPLVADTEMLPLNMGTMGIQRTHTDDTVPYDTMRHYRVSAINAAGVGRPSLAHGAKTGMAMDPDPPLPPSGLVAYPDEAEAIVLVWNGESIEHDHDSDSNNDEERIVIQATRYKIEYSTSCDDAVDSDVDPNSPDDDPCTGFNMGVAPERDSTIVDTVGEGHIIYDVGNVDADDFDDARVWRHLDYVPGTMTSYRHEGLLAEQTRDYRVFAVNRNGQSKTSSMSARATTDEAADVGIPKAPMLERDTSTGLRLDMASPQDKIIIEWQAANGEAPADDPVTSYIVEVSSNDATTWAEVPGSPVTEMVDTDEDDEGDVWRLVHESLVAGTELHYRVRGVNTKGEGANSSEVFIRTSSPIRATWPEDDTADDPAVTASTDLPGRIMLSWDALDDPAGSPVTGYRIEVSENGTSGWVDVNGAADADATASDTTYTHMGLGDDETRHYRVFAINACCESQPSAVAMGKTASADAPEPEVTPPGDASGLTGAVSGTDINLSWTAGENAQFHRVFGIRENADGSLDYSPIIWQATGATGSATVDMIGKASGTWQFFVIAGRGTSADDSDAVWSASWSSVDKVTY